MTIQNVYGATPPGSVNVSNDTITLAHIFKVGVDGIVVGARWYEGASISPTTGCIAALWTISGTLLASKTFDTPVSNGWADINFDSPISVIANTPYVIGIFNSNTHPWSATFGGLTTDVVSGDITFLGFANDPTAIGQGRFDTSGSLAFPVSASAPHSSYGVDVSFDASAPVDQLLDGVSNFVFSSNAALQVTRQIFGNSNLVMAVSADITVQHVLVGVSNILMSGIGNIRRVQPIVPSGNLIFKVPDENRVVKIPLEKRLINVSK